MVTAELNAGGQCPIPPPKLIVALMYHIHAACYACAKTGQVFQCNSQTCNCLQSHAGMCTMQHLRKFEPASTANRHSKKCLGQERDRVLDSCPTLTRHALQLCPLNVAPPAFCGCSKDDGVKSPPRPCGGTPVAAEHKKRPQGGAANATSGT